MRPALALVLTAAMLAGCATVDEQANADPDGRYYVTGSNIKLHSSRGHVSQTKTITGESLQDAGKQLPGTIPRPEGYRGAGD